MLFFFKDINLLGLGKQEARTIIFWKLESGSEEAEEKNNFHCRILERFKNSLH